MLSHPRLAGTVALTAAVVLLAPTATAQFPEPAPEVAAYHQLLGKWSGEGGGEMAGPDGSHTPFTWTSHSVYEKALGGHFVRETSVIEVEGMGRLCFRSYLGYDQRTGKYVAAAIGNMGGVTYQEITWPAKGQMMTAATMKQEGTPTGERWLTTVDGDTLKMEGRSWSGWGAEYRHVHGTMKRVDEVPALAVEAAAPILPTPPQMARLARMADTYAMEGEATMGGVTMPITATEHQRMLFGGSVLEMSVQSPEMPGGQRFEGWGAFSWNAERGCYDAIWVDNMGSVAHSENRFVGDQLVSTQASMMDGKPFVSRGVASFDDEGKLTHIVEHVMAGAAPPAIGFEARYTRVD